MDPLQSLTDSSRKDTATDTAPAAAVWLHNPTSIEKRKTYAQTLAECEPWTGPDEDEEENPAND